MGCWKTKMKMHYHCQSSSVCQPVQYIYCSNLILCMCVSMYVYVFAFLFWIKSYSIDTLMVNAFLNSIFIAVDSDDDDDSDGNGEEESCEHEKIEH